MNNTCKLLTAIATLAAFGAEGMQQTPNTWAHEIEAVKDRHEDRLALFLSVDYLDKVVSFFAPTLFDGFLHQEATIPAEEASPLRELIFRKGRIFTAQALVVADMLDVSVPELTQCILEVNDDNWGSYGHVETGARLIALVAERERADSRTILAAIKQQADQNLQRHRRLIDKLTSDYLSFEKILAQHGL